MPDTTRAALPYPAADRSDPYLVAENIGDLAQRADAVFAMADQGTLAGRPAAGIARRLFYATDVGIAYYDTGAAWIMLAPAGGGFVGELRDFVIPAASLPAGWLACDGTAVQRTSYPALYAALGAAASPWGQGDGVNTFNLPDLRGRGKIHAGQGGGLSARAVGERFGEEAHALSVPELPSHAHGGASGGGGSHNHVAQDGVAALLIEGSSFVVSTPQTLPHDNSGGATRLGSTSTAPNHTHPIAPEGGGGTHNNMPPVAVVVTAVKAL